MLALALLMCAQHAHAAPEAALDEGPLVDAVEHVLAGADDVVRLALPPVDDPDDARRALVERALVRAIRDRRREELLTPATLRARVRTPTELAALAPFACDHVLLAAVVDDSEGAALRLRLVRSDSGAVRAETSARLGRTLAGASAKPSSMRLAMEDLVEQLAAALEGQGVEVATHRVGVPRLAAADGAVTASRVDVFAHAELTRALLRRGFLVVERARLDAALGQAALGQELGDDSAPAVGRLAGADSLVLGQVADGGPVFVVSARVVDVGTGVVRGAGAVRLPRDHVVARADVETRTPAEAAFRSAVAPGWGQAYNGHGLKSVVWAVGTYGGLLSAVGLGVGGALAWRSYVDLKPGDGLTADEVRALAPERRELANALLLSSAIAASLTLALWGAGIVDALVSAPSQEEGT